MTRAGAEGPGTTPLPDLAATERYARVLATSLPRGALLLLDGPLGAGKTTLTAALVRALGSEAAVSSPTYTLIHEYPTPDGVVVHVDAYRLPDPAALLDLGLDDYLERARLVVVEWGAPLVDRYPDAYLLRLERSADGAEGRRAHLETPSDPAV